MKIVFIILTVLAIGTYLSMMSEAVSAPQQAVAAGAGCFFAIMARLAQAEYHANKVSKGETVPALPMPILEKPLV